MAQDTFVRKRKREERRSIKKKRNKRKAKGNNINTGINQFALRREQYAHRGGSHLFSYLCRHEQDLNDSIINVY
jgi:hypothetical protein